MEVFQYISIEPSETTSCAPTAPRDGSHIPTSSGHNRVLDRIDVRCIMVCCELQEQLLVWVAPWIWAWVKIEAPENHKCWSMFPLTRVQFWGVPMFEPRPCLDSFWTRFWNRRKQWSGLHLTDGTRVSPCVIDILLGNQEEFEASDFYWGP